MAEEEEKTQTLIYSLVIDQKFSSFMEAEGLLSVHKSPPLDCILSLMNPISQPHILKQMNK
jgi:hypothetical protein